MTRVNNQTTLGTPPAAAEVKKGKIIDDFIENCLAESNLSSLKLFNLIPAAVPVDDDLTKIRYLLLLFGKIGYKLSQSDLNNVCNSKLFAEAIYHYHSGENCATKTDVSQLKDELMNAIRILESFDDEK
jgi:hypothetical protein